MEPRQFSFTHVHGQDFRTRAVGFIEEATKGDLDAKRVYEALKPTVQHKLDTRFKHWLDRVIYNKYFHGFPGDHGTCFTFKWEERHIPQRLYGFICHPKPYTDAGFELCSLMYYDTKADKTNYTILGWINQWSVHPLVVAAIGQQYPEFLMQTTRKNKWTQ